MNGHSAAARHVTGPGAGRLLYAKFRGRYEAAVPEGAMAIMLVHCYLDRL